MMPKPTDKLLRWASGHYCSNHLPLEVIAEGEKATLSWIEENRWEMLDNLPADTIWDSIRVLASDVQEMLDGGGK